MTKNKLISVCLALIVSLGFCSVSLATTIFSDDFESYADTTAMNAVWANGGTATLDPNQGNPGSSLFHPGSAGSFSGGNTNTVSVAGLTPTTANPIVYSADIYDDGTSGNKRVTAGLRAAAGANLFEMGMYNNPSHYAVRVVLPGPSWLAFSNIVDDGGSPISNSPVVGWHRYQVTLDGTQATFTLDLGSTGIINATEIVPVAFNGGFPLDQIRLGGPSDFSSAGGGANFDNVSLAVVPEPTTLALLGIAAVGLAVRRRS